MQTVKRRTFAGAVCLQEVYPLPDFIAENQQARRMAAPRPRFKSDEERRAHSDGICMRRHAMLVNANFSPASLYSTLTFDDDYEVHTFADARKVRDKFIRRLRYKYPAAKLIVYMGRGKSTSRIHFHMLSDGIPREYIEKQWKCGSVVRIEHLKKRNFYDGVDIGQDYTGLANYLWRHWSEEQGGRHYKRSGRFTQPEREEPTVCKRRYSEAHPPVAPKGYRLVNAHCTPYGYMAFRYVRIPQKRRRQ